MKDVIIYKLETVSIAEPLQNCMRKLPIWAKFGMRATVGQLGRNLGEAVTTTTERRVAISRWALLFRLSCMQCPSLCVAVFYRLDSIHGRSQGGSWRSWDPPPNPIPLKIVKDKTCTHYMHGLCIRLVELNNLHNIVHSTPLNQKFWLRPWFYTVTAMQP